MKLLPTASWMAAAACALLGGCVVAPVYPVAGHEETVYAPVAPPLSYAEAPPPAPSPVHVWITGYWGWSAGHYHWHPGYWAVPPRPGHVWHPRRWQHGPRGWHPHGGRWGPR